MRLTEFLSANCFGIGIKAEQDSLVDQWILLLCPGTFLNLLTSRSNNRLDFVTVDQTSHIRVEYLGSRQTGNLLNHEAEENKSKTYT